MKKKRLLSIKVPIPVQVSNARVASSLMLDLLGVLSFLARLDYVFAVRHDAVVPCSFDERTEEECDKQKGSRKTGYGSFYIGGPGDPHGLGDIHKVDTSAGEIRCGGDIVE